jgi:uncharacterized membrane protein YcaP (DUF421 family)
MTRELMTSEPPRPPRTPRALKVTPEQLVGVMMFAGTITAGALQDLGDVLLTAGRIAAIYVFLTAAFRLIGKRELSALSPLELITLMLIPEIASGTLNGEGPLLGALVGISVLLLLVFMVSLLSARFEVIEKAVEPPPRVLVIDGAMCQDAMQRERITAEELFTEMHKHGIGDLRDVRWAILESGGDIAFIRSDRASVSPSANRRSSE